MIFIRGCEYGKGTAGPSTALRSGRDDNSVAGQVLSRLSFAAQQNCHPDRSVAQWRDLRFLSRTHTL
jgi:hypothetical protein